MTSAREPWESRPLCVQHTGEDVKSLPAHSSRRGRGDGGWGVGPGSQGPLAAQAQLFLACFSEFRLLT